MKKHPNADIRLFCIFKDVTDADKARELFNKNILFRVWPEYPKHAFKLTEFVTEIKSHLASFVRTPDKNLYNKFKSIPSIDKTEHEHHGGYVIEIDGKPFAPQGKVAIYSTSIIAEKAAATLRQKSWNDGKDIQVRSVDTH